MLIFITAINFRYRALQACIADTPADWRRRPGSSRQSWLRTVETDLRPLNLGPASAKRRTQDRAATRGNGNMLMNREPTSVFLAYQERCEMFGRTQYSEKWRPAKCRDIDGPITVLIRKFAHQFSNSDSFYKLRILNEDFAANSVIRTFIFAAKYLRCGGKCCVSFVGDSAVFSSLKEVRIICWALTKWSIWAFLNIHRWLRKQCNRQLWQALQSYKLLHTNTHTCFSPHFVFTIL